jgi:hypothetical protein
MQALLQQRDQLVFAHALAPAGQRGAVERQLMAEEFFPAEQLVIGVLQPPPGFALSLASPPSPMIRGGTESHTAPSGKLSRKSSHACLRLKPLTIERQRISGGTAPQSLWHV